ncbi:MAG: hypothetical protein H0U51_05150 [Propionibacteriales bacterium]|nr:hypothetical protein [Propionibacteriales bacterium]
MQQFETDLTRALGALADDADPAAPDRVVSAVNAATSGRRRLGRLKALGLGITVAAASVALLDVTGVLEGAGGTNSSPPAAIAPGSDEGDFISLPVKPGEPCFGAQQFSLPELALRADAPIWLPNTQDASIRTLTGAWTCGGSTPLLTFGDITISYEGGWDGVDPEKKWTSYVKYYGEGRVETILGIPALVQPKSEEVTNPEVLAIVDGTLIRLHGRADVSVEQLVEVAKSIDLNDPVSG